MQQRFQIFTVLISNINRAIRKIKTAEMAEFNLKSPHVSCLYYLYYGENLTAKELSDICQEDKASISRSIDYLEKSGYIYCNAETKKRYKSPLALTQSGKAVAKKIAKKIDSILDSASVGLGEEDRVVLYRSLALINENLTKICEKHGD